MRVLTVDLGTSNTVAVLSAPGRPPRVVDVDGASAMPSAVFATEDGRLVAGREAVRLARSAPARFEPNPKRRVDDGTLLLGDVVVPVASALGAVLGKVVAEASRQLGGVLPDQVRLTHPVRWGTARCAVLLEAARQAGVGAVVQLVPEPVAAAAHFASATGRVLAPGQALAVYDLGAGTFDAAVVGAGQHGLTVLAESGLSDLGGLDIDQALLDHLGRQVGGRDPDAWRRLVTPGSAEDRRASLALREDVRVAKEALSEHPQTEVAMPEPFGSVLVTRAELETPVRPGLLRSVELLGSTTRGAGMDVGWLAGVYLVGGSSRIPLVATLMAEQLGVVPTALDQPETAVALGAHQIGLGSLGARTWDVPAAAAPYPPPHRPSGRRTGGAAVVGALSVLIVAAVVAVVVLAPWRDGPSSGSDDGIAAEQPGPNGVGGFHWAMTREEAGFYEGMWPLPDGVVFGHWKGLTAYDVETGAELWSWEVPGDAFLCNLSPNVTASGLGAVTYGPRGGDGGQRCHTLQVISVESGEPEWDEPVSLVDEGFSGAVGKTGGTSLSISDGLVTASYGGGASQTEHSTDLTWFDTRTGERLGSTDVGAEPVEPSCRLTGFAHAVDDSVLAVSRCADSTRLLEWSKDDPGWAPGTELEGCGEFSNFMGGGFLRPAGKHHLLAGCFDAAGLRRLHLVGSGHFARPVDISGAGVGSVEDRTAGHPPTNLLTDGDGVFVVRGEEGETDGVVRTSEGQPWEYAVPDATEVRLLAVADHAVTLLVVTPGPATLYTVAGPNEAVQTSGLDPEVVKKLPGADATVRVGDYLVCAFTAVDEHEPVIGAVRMTS
ncbi:Hsp70 family protein [Actinophytocola sp. S1-96]|uniref:Hsp70 family protein n=1 Tax=Actinophytocola gossypii TaxID=2812003 RepID=A0ABT2JDD2_9PSEU|nr:Hsp70 family protein [Actinophytocola gossypii]